MSQQQTRRLRRANQPKEPERTKVLSQISPPSIAAASLAAVTSFLLSSKLGLTGSLIGAGIAAAVSTTASQLYNAMIKRSMETVHDVSGHVAAMVGKDDETPTATVSGRTQVRRAPVRLADIEATEVLPASGSPVAPRALRARAARQRGATLAMRTFLVALATALVALAVYFVIVHAATRGRGIGPTTLVPLSEITEEQSTETIDATASEEQADTADESAQYTSLTGDGSTGDTGADAATTTTEQEQVPSQTVDGGTTDTDANASSDQTSDPSQESSGGTSVESGGSEAQSGQDSTATTTTTTVTSTGQTGSETAS